MFHAFEEQLRPLEGGNSDWSDAEILTHKHTHTYTQPPTRGSLKTGIMSYIFRYEWGAIFSSPIFLLLFITWSKKWALPFDVRLCLVCVCVFFPLFCPLWLPEPAGLFTGLHNEVLIITGPHQVSLGPQLRLLLT